MFINIIYVGPGMPSPRVKDKQALMGKLRAAYARRPTACRYFYRVFFLSFI